MCLAFLLQTGILPTLLHPLSLLVFALLAVAGAWATASAVSVWRLNTIVLSLLLLLGLAVIALGVSDSGFIFFVPLVLLYIVAIMGMIANVTFFFWNVVHIRFRQAIFCCLAFVLLIVALYLIHYLTSDLHYTKMSG